MKKSHYHPFWTLRDAIKWTVLKGPLTPEQLDDKIDYSASALRRAGLDGDSGAGFNLHKLIPLMDAQGDYTILELLAHRCNFLLVPIPRGGRSKKERVSSVSEYQMLVTAATAVLVKFINQGASQEEAVEHLYTVLRGTAEMIKEVEAGDQISMDFNPKGK